MTIEPEEEAWAEERAMWKRKGLWPCGGCGAPISRRRLRCPACLDAFHAELTAARRVMKARGQRVSGRPRGANSDTLLDIFHNRLVE
jgi:hypothetical protein